MPATVIPINQSQMPSFVAPRNWGFSQASYTFLATKLVKSDRYAELERRESYRLCTQHDYKRYDFDARSIRPGPWTMQQPLLSNQAAPFYVPLAQRKPCAPLRLGRQMCGAFTKLAFGEDRWPDIICKEDEDTQDYVTELTKVAHLPTRMIQARDKAGGQGACGLSWYFHNGLPIVEVHDVKTLHVHEWADQSCWKPAHVTKCYQHARSEWDPQKRAIVQKLYWYRRDWTAVADIFYVEVEVKDAQEPAWQIDEARSSLHGDGFCHFIWMQNTPSEEQDGRPDYDGLYEKLDEVDTINSVVCRGGKLNLDPTLQLNMEPEAVVGSMIKKGSDNALITGLSGKASYLELSGQSLEAGGKLVDRLRQQILEEGECVIPDPDKVAAGAVASVALAMVYAPMMARLGLIRESAGEAIVELLTQMLTVVRKRGDEVLPETDAAGNITDKSVTNYLLLPPKVVETEDMDDAGEKTGEMTITITERQPGKGKRLELAWGPPFKPNSIDIQNTVTTMSTATAGKAVISQRSAVEVVATLLGKDPKVVMEEIQQDNHTAMAMNGSMFGMPPAGDTLTGPEAGKLAATGAPLPGATPELDPEAELEKGAAQEATEHGLGDEQARKIAQDHLDEDPTFYSKPQGAGAVPGMLGAPAPEAPEKPKLSLTSTDLGAIVTVNEARAQYGFGPWPGADGELSLAEFKVKHAAVVSGSAQTDKGQDPNKPPPVPVAFGAKPGAPPFGGKPGVKSGEQPSGKVPSGAPEEDDPKPGKKPPFLK